MDCNYLRSLSAPFPGQNSFMTVFSHFGPEAPLVQPEELEVLGTVKFFSNPGNTTNGQNYR